MADTLRDLVIRLGFDVNTSTLPQIDRQLAGVTNQATKMDKALGGAFARFAGPAALAAGAFKGVSMVKDTLVEAGDAAVEFGRDMGAIQTLAGKDPGRVLELRKNIQGLAQDTGRSSKEIAAAVNDVLQVFDDSADTMKLAEIATRGATASGTDARTAFDLLSSTMLQFGKTGAVAARETMDMAFAMRQFGKVEISQMAHGLGEVASGMKEIGGTEKELFAIIGATAGITGPVDQSFTQLNSVITALTTPTKDLQKVYKELGITSIEAAVRQDGLYGVMKKIYETTGGSIEKFKLLVPDARAGRMFGPLVTTHAARYAEAVDRVAKSTGAAAEADKLFRGGLNKTGTELDRLDTRYKTISENLGNRLGPAQVAWRELQVTAIGAIDAIAARIEKEGSDVQDKDSGFLTMQKQSKFGRELVGQGIGALGALGVAKLSGDEKGAAEIRARFSRERERILDAGDPMRRSLKAAREGAALDQETTAQSKAGVKAIVSGNTFTFTLPPNANAREYSDSVANSIESVTKQIAWDVRLASSGDSP